MSIRVLVVDDSSTLRKIISRSLHQADLGIAEVCEASNGKEALKLLSQQPVDLVLTDINMPEMNGIELLSEIKRSDQWNTIPVLMITTEAGADAVVSAANSGAKGYIKKPFTPGEIRDQLLPVLKSLPRS